MIRFRKFGLKYLDFELSMTREARIRIIERPGLWMARGELWRVISDLRAVVFSSLARDLPYGILSGEQQFLDKAIIALLYDKTSGCPIAFSAMSLIDIELHGRPITVLHLGLVMVDPKFRTLGLSRVLCGLSCILALLRNHLRPLWISNVTQVPSAVGMFIDAFADVFPRPYPPSRPSLSHLCVAREIMKKHRNVFGVGEVARFDTRRFIITNAYTGGSDNLRKTFFEAPKHRDEAINKMCHERLDFERGDDFLMIGVFNLEAARNYLLRSLPQNSLLALFHRFAFALLESLLLPVIHWLASIKRRL